MQGVLTDINNSLSGINTVLAGKAATNHGHNAATAQTAGFMAAADKAKLDGIAAKATANTASATVPKALGAASAGSEAGFSRGDHVHPKPSAADIGALPSNGKAATAGTADTAKACSGNAATATKLATARTIRTNLASGNAVNFDGSGNITPGVTGILPVANGGTGANSVTEARKNLNIQYAPMAIGYLGLSGNVVLGFIPKMVFIVGVLTSGLPAGDYDKMMAFFGTSQINNSWFSIKVTFNNNGFSVEQFTSNNGSKSEMYYFVLGTY